LALPPVNYVLACVFRTPAVEIQYKPVPKKLWKQKLIVCTNYNQFQTNEFTLVVLSFNAFS
jgi:hypothetical protein